MLIEISSCLFKFLSASISLTYYFPNKGIYNPIQPSLLWLLSKVQWHSLIFSRDLNVRNFEQLPQKKWWSKSNKVKKKKEKDKRKKIKENHNSLSLYYKWSGSEGDNDRYHLKGIEELLLSIFMLGFTIKRSETKLRYL